MKVDDILKTKEALEKNANKGFGYFLKNVGMILLIFIKLDLIILNLD